MAAGKGLMAEIEAMLDASQGLRIDQMQRRASRPVSSRAVRYAARQLVREGRARPDRDFRPHWYYKNVPSQKADA